MHPVCERIKVAAIFAPGAKIRPVWFEWRSQKRSITGMNYFWKERFGESTRLHFAVTDGSNQFELMFDSSTHAWTLEAVAED